MNQYLEQLFNPHLISFYGWWQFAVSLVAFLGLMAIWWHIGRKQKDIGQVWLALSVLCWSFSGVLDIYYAQHLLVEQAPLLQTLNELIGNQNLGPQKIQELNESFQSVSNTATQQNNILDGWRSILSLFNSLFILLALPWFKYIPGQLEGFIKSKYWYPIIGLPFLFSLLPTISKMLSSKTLSLISELDVYYGMLTLIFLGAVLWESFIKRRLTLLAWLTLFVVLFTSVAQVYKLTASSFDLTLFSAIFKTSLIMLFFALALSWVKELAQNILPGPQQLFLKFDRQKNEKGKFQNLINLKGIPGKENTSLILTPMMYDLLASFAQRKLSGDDWLEIKPKNESRSTKIYDIKDHNQIKRLTSTLLDGLFGKGNWSRDQHFIPLKDCLFEMSEKRERKIRLRLPKENITL